MKYFILIFLNFSMAFCQTLTSDQIEILSQEILRTKTDHPQTSQFIGDSLLINHEIYRRPLIFEKYSSEAIEYKYLTQYEIKKIFGKYPHSEFLQKKHKLIWDYEDFPNLKIAFYSYNKYIKYVEGIKTSVFLDKGNFISLGIPVVKKDRMYAIIQWYTEYNGNSISVYKNISGKWKFYKTFSSMYF